MKFGQALHFVLVAMATVLLCSVPPACSLPYGDMKAVKHKLMLEERNEKDGEDKSRLQMKKMPGIDVVPVTSLQVPSTSTEYEEGVAAISQETLCNKMSRTSGSCKTLHEALTHHFSVPGNSLRLDTSYNAFTLADLFFSGLLEGPLNDPSYSEQHMVRRGNQVCDNLLSNWLKPRNVASGRCSWHYKCVYDPNTFPSFKVEAQIDNPESLVHCVEVKMSFVTVFKKESCPEDPCPFAENWVEKNNQEIVVGFTEVE